MKTFYMLVLCLDLRNPNWEIHGYHNKVNTFIEICLKTATAEF